MSLASDAVSRLDELIEFRMLPGVSAGGGLEVTYDSKTTGERDV